MVSILALAVVGQTYNKDISVNVTRSTSKAPPLSITPTAKFSVAIFNGTKKDVKVLNDQCSWGYDSLSFEIKDTAGKTYKVTRIEKKWDRNFPVSDSIGVLGAKIRKIDFGDKTWQGMPSAVGGRLDGWKLRVNLKVEASPLLTKDEFWTGSLQSGWVEATMAEHQN